MEWSLGRVAAVGETLRHASKEGLHLGRLVANLGMGEPKGRGASGGMCLVPAAIPGLLERRAVIAETVRLDNESEIRPEEVDPEAVQSDAGLWQRQACLAHEPKEHPLELGIGETKTMAIEEPEHCARSGLSAHSIQRRPQSIRIGQVQIDRLVDCRLQLGLRQPNGEVGQGSRRAGHRDPVSSPPILGREHAAAMDHESPRPAPIARPDGDFDPSTKRLFDFPQLSSGLMAQEHVRSTRQYGRHPAFHTSDIATADDENPAVKSAKAGRGKSGGRWPCR